MSTVRPADGPGRVARLAGATTSGSLLVAIWLLLWGDVSIANVVSGALLAGALLWFLPDARQRSHPPVIRPVALARLGSHLLVQLVRSNWLLTREVLSPRPRIRTGVVAVPLDGCTDELLTLITNFVTLTPGTTPVEVERDPPRMTVHVLHLRDGDTVRREIWRLRDLTVRAFGTAEAIAALAAARGPALDAPPHAPAPADPDGGPR